jgi:single-stranded DNA-binding protein
MAKKQIIGHVGRATLSYGETGKARLNFTVAESNDFKDTKSGEWQKRPPTWYELTLWQEAAEKNAWLTTGMKVLVTFDRLMLREWASGGKSGVSLQVQNVESVYELVSKHGNGNGNGNGNGSGNGSIEQTQEAEEIA